MEPANNPFPVFSKTERFEARYPSVAFGLALISGCRNHLNPPGFDLYKRKLLRKMRKRETLAEISARIAIYNDFFSTFGFNCPLPKHLKRTINSGFPRYNLMVDTHFVAEMCAGILVATTDYDKFCGNLFLDLATADEFCAGMGEREFRTKENEIVFRDEEGIVCILCQGADEKTRVTSRTRNVLFYAYAVPGIDGQYLTEGLKLAAETMREFGGGRIEGIEVY